MTVPEVPRSTRRRFLRTAVNVGVGAGLVWGAGADFATPGDTVEIEYARVRSPPEGGSITRRTKTVPADWYSSVRAAFDVQRKLRSLGLSSLVGSFVVPGTFDDPIGSIAVDATTDGAAEEVSNVADDVEIDVTVLDEIPPKPADSEAPSDPFQVTDLDRTEVPGGVLCRAPALSGTLAPAAYDVERGRRYFLTSNHVFGDEGTKETEHRNAPLFLESEEGERIIGRVDRGYPVADVVTILPVDGRRPASAIARATPSTVVGQFTKLGLADLMARDETLHTFGAFSGHAEGQIHGVDGFTCYVGEVCKPGQVKWGDKRTMTDGDSGSVNYHPDPENPDQYVIVGGINNARSWWPGADFAWGTGAHHLLDAVGIHF